MTPLAQRFARLSETGEKGLVLFITAGDPGLEELPLVLEALTEGGADVIEIGIPFSDPIADGPTIQASSQRALDSGVTPRAVLDALEWAQNRVRDLPPIVLMGYWNPVLRVGPSSFAESARKAGASGTIISDLIPEEAEEWVRVSRAAELDTVFLAAPTSTDERLQSVCRHSSGFVYAVSRTGVTGASDSVAAGGEDLVRRIKACGDLPVCVGFGISNPEQVREVCRYADGAVVGSWLVDKLHREWDAGKGREALVRSIGELKEATRG
jgi:tryptophan synthase alpha chain